MLAKIIDILNSELKCPIWLFKYIQNISFIYLFSLDNF